MHDAGFLAQFVTGQTVLPLPPCGALADRNRAKRHQKSQRRRVVLPDDADLEPPVLVRRGPDPAGQLTQRKPVKSRALNWLIALGRSNVELS